MVPTAVRIIITDSHIVAVILEVVLVNDEESRVAVIKDVDTIGRRRDPEGTGIGAIVIINTVAVVALFTSQPHVSISASGVHAGVETGIDVMLVRIITLLPCLYASIAACRRFFDTITIASIEIHNISIITFLIILLNIVTTVFELALRSTSVVILRISVITLLRRSHDAVTTVFRLAVGAAVIAGLAITIVAVLARIQHAVTAVPFGYGSSKQCRTA